MVYTAISKVGVLLLLLASASLVQAVKLWSALHSPPMSSEFEYWPPEWPADPSRGWNWTGNFAPYEPGPMRMPAFFNQARPYTKRAGARITGRFFGFGVIMGGWTTNGSRVTATLNDVSRTFETTGGTNRTVVKVEIDFSMEQWYNMTITLEKGELQIHNITYLTGVEGNYRVIDEAPTAEVDTTQNNGQEITRYYNVTRDEDWSAQRLFEPGRWDVEMPHLSGKPGASLTFKTWPNASYVRISARVGYKGGKITRVIDPVPFGMTPALEYNLSRPIEGIVPICNQHLKPTERYTITITNSDPEKELSFSGASYILASDATKDWDWRSESVGAINSTAEGTPGGSNDTTSDSPGANSSEADIGTNGEAGKNTNVGAIVGGVIGGVIGVAALVAALYWYFRRRRHEDGDSIVDDTAMANDAHVSHGQQRQQPFGDPETAQVFGENQSQRGLLSPSQDGQSYRMQESDAGPVGMDTIPPSYNSAWAGSGAAREPSPIEPPAPASGSVSNPIRGSATAANDLAADNDTRYVQAKRDHAALFSPLTRFIQAKREHMALFSTPEVKDAASDRDPGPLPAKGKERASPQVKDEDSPSDDSDAVPR